MSKTKSVYPRGHFFQQMAGAHQVSAEAMVSDRGFFGLVPSATFLYGCVRTDDGEMFEICRRFSHNALGRSQTLEETVGKPPSYLQFQSTEIDGLTLRYDLARMQGQAVSNNYHRGLEGDDAVWRSPAEADGNPFEVRFSEERCVWTETGLFSLEGAIIKPGLHWYLPGRDYGTYYVSQFFHLTGEIQGRPCRGMIAFDQTYMGEGGAVYVSKDLVMENRAHVIWYTWGVRYKNGDVEAGHFMLGHGLMGFAVYTDGETVVATQDIQGRTIPKANSPFGARIELTIDGEAWEFLPDPRGAMPDMMRKHPPTPQQEGRWRRVGDTREPESWFAWGETEPEHGSFPVDRLPTEPIRA